MDGRRAPPGAAWGLLAASCVGAALLVPWRPNRVHAALDASWMWAVNEALVHRLELGRQLVFTTGPLAFLYTRTAHPATVVGLWVWWSVIAVTWSLLVWRVLGRASWGAVVRAATFAAVTATAALSPDAFFLSLPVLAACVRRAPGADAMGAERGGRADEVAAAALLAIAALVKFTFFLGGVAAILVLAAEDLWRRRWPVRALVFGAGVLLLWVGTGQPLGAFPAFLGWSGEIARGYADTMHLPGSRGGRLRLLAIAAAVWSTAAVVAVVALRRRSVRAAVVGLVLVGISVLAVKAGFTRLDWHEAITAVWAPCALTLAWATIWPAAAGSRLRALAIGTALLYPMAAVVVRLQRSDVTEALQSPGQVLRSEASLARPATLLADVKLDFERARAAVAAHHPVPRAAGTYDVYPWAIGVVFANRLPYAPRPVPQSYSAYTPALAELNAGHLRRPDAADNLLFTIAPIDGRHPAMDDGASWGAIWARYAFVADTAGFLWLRRRPAPLDEPLPRLLGTARTRLGAPFAVPAVGCGGVWMRAELRPTLAYRLKALAWQPPVVRMEALGAPGEPARSWRVLPELVRAGFLAWPVVENRGQFAQLMTTGRLDGPGAAPAARVRLAVDAGRPERYFAADVPVRFYHLAPPGACAR